MDDWSFGITLTVVGVGGTFSTLWLLSLVIDGLKRIFPLRASDDSGAPGQ